MRRITTLLAGLLVLVVVAPSTAATPRLTGTTGPGFTITVKRNGVKVKSLKAGKYTLVVADKSNFHNFRIKGPGLNRAITSVPFTGTKTVTVTLRAGRYTYQCDPHVPGMKGTFRVTR